jgi:hypothetical protein
MTVVTCQGADREQCDQEGYERREAPAYWRETWWRFRLGFTRQVGDELVELTEGLGLVAAFQSLLQLGCVETALCVAAANAFSGRFAIGVRRAKLWVATETQAPE